MKISAAWIEIWINRLNVVMWSRRPLSALLKCTLRRYIAHIPPICTPVLRRACSLQPIWISCPRTFKQNLFESSCPNYVCELSVCNTYIIVYAISIWEGGRCWNHWVYGILKGWVLWTAAKTPTFTKNIFNFIISLKKSSKILWINTWQYMHKYTLIRLLTHIIDLGNPKNIRHKECILGKFL